MSSVNGTQTGIPSEPPRLVKDINQLSQGSYPSQYLVIGATTFFTSDDGIYGKELWKTDGTTLGTVMVKDIRPGSDASMPDELRERQRDAVFYRQ